MSDYDSGWMLDDETQADVTRSVGTFAMQIRSKFTITRKRYFNLAAGWISAWGTETTSAISYWVGNDARSALPLDGHKWRCTSDKVTGVDGVEWRLEIQTWECYSEWVYYTPP